MSITVDVGRLLTDVGSSLYKSGGTILDELVQNAQRAKAHTFRVTFCRAHGDGEISVLEVSDDGKGLKKAQDLLKVASSGWDKGVQDTDSPFGMGFWSTVTATSRVEVRSNSFEIAIDSDKLHDKKSVRGVVTTVENAEPFEGFRVRLYSPPRPPRQAEEENRRWTAWEDLAKAVDGLDTLVKFTEFRRVEYRYDGDYGNDDVNKARHFLESTLRDRSAKTFATAEPLSVVPSNIPFAKRIENEFFEGVLWPQASSWEKALNAPVLGMHFYAQKRVVQSRNYANVAGWLHLKSGAVNLRAPDRKDFIEDKKHTTVMEAYSDVSRNLLIDMAMVATDAEMEAFDSALRYALKDEDVLSLIPYIFGQAALDERGNETETRGGELPAMSPRKVNPSVEWAEDEHFSSQGGAPEIPFEPRVKRKMFEFTLPAVWVEGSEEEKYKEQLTTARNAGLPVVVGRSAMQRRALALKAVKDARLVHVKDLGGKVTTEADVKAPRFKFEEGKYLLPALEKLAQAVGAEKVKIGHLVHRRILVVGEERIPLPAKEGAIILGMNVGNTIYIDASYALGVAREAAQKHSPPRYIFFRLLSTVAHERAHQLTPAPDGTPEHLGTIETVLHVANDWIAENL